MSSRSDLVQDLQASLAGLADPATRAWWERYLKGAAPFRGVRMDHVREALHAWHGRHDLADRDPDEQFELALELVRQPMTEDRLAGMLYFREILLPQGALRWRTALPVWAELFTTGALADWNACDWFCARVLGPVAGVSGQRCSRTIAAWSKSENLWQQRASVVAFVELARRGDENFRGFVAMVLGACRRVVKNPERFAQTGVGWVLRELSVAAPGKVESFILRNFGLMSPEAIRSAVKKLPESAAAAAAGAKK